MVIPASLDDQPLLVWAEQGFGDNIQFVRYVQILLEAGVKVTLSTRKPLMRLFKECLQPHAPVIVEHKSEELQGFQHHVALLSLPGFVEQRGNYSDDAWIFPSPQTNSRSVAY